MLGLDAPIELDRAEAARQAAVELADPAYRTGQRSWLDKAVNWLSERLSELLDRASTATPGGWWGFLGLAIVVVATVVLVRWQVGPVSKSRTTELTVDPSVTAGEYRSRARSSAAAGDWGDAIGLRMAAVVRCAEERGIAPARPSRTVDELANLVAAKAPQAGPSIRQAVAAFDRVKYGGRHADQATYEAIARADDELASAPRLIREVSA